MGHNIYSSDCLHRQLNAIFNANLSPEEFDQLVNPYSVVYSLERKNRSDESKANTDHGITSSKFHAQ